MLTYPVGFLGAAKKNPLTIASACSYSSATSFTANLGAAGADIFVAVVCYNAGSSGAPPTSVTVGGLSLTRVANAAAGSDGGSIWFGAGPSSGGNQTVAVTGGGSMIKVYKAYVIRGSVSASFDAKASSVGTSVSLRAAAGGVVAAIETSINAAASVWTGATNNDHYNTGSLDTSWASYAATAAESAHAISVDRSDGSPLIAASFKP